MTSITAPPTELPFELGKPQSFQGLGLIPLFSRDEPALEYIGLDEAAAAGLVVTEIDQSGSVGTLAVSNPLKDNVLLYEGEELIGAKQNRVLERTILVHAQSKTPVPVNCVERGRWSYRSEQFATAPRAAHPQMRRMSREAGQAGVWAEISAKSARLDAASPTDAVEAVFFKHSSSLDEYLAALPRQEGQCGAIVAVGGRVVCLDYVSRSEVYAGLYAKLLRGYALDAVEQPGDAPVPEDYARLLVRRIARAKRGLGTPAGPRRRPRRRRTRRRRLRARPRRRGRRPQRLPDRSGVRSSAVAVDS